MFVLVIPCLEVTSFSLADLESGAARGQETPVRQSETTAFQKGRRVLPLIKD